LIKGSLQTGTKKRKKRVCVVRHGYYPEGTRIYKEIGALAAVGYEVDVICLSGFGRPAHEQIDGVRVYRMPYRHRRGSTARYMLLYGLSILLMGVVLSLLWCRRRYTCIQINTMPDALVFITALPRLFGARVLLDLHEPTPELLLTKYNGKVHKHMLRFQILIERWAIRYAHRVITVNDTIRQRFIERGADPDKIAVIRNVPPEDFGISVPPREPHDGLMLITHGTLQPRYGHSTLLRALPLIRQRIDGVHLVVAGQGETEEELKRLTVELGCENMVTFAGPVSYRRIAELIIEADIGIVPLLPGPFSELCQPQKLFEYIALKVPVVAAHLPAIKESFDDSCIQYFTAGDVQNLADSIVTLAEDARHRESLATNAFNRYQTLCWREVKKDYLRIVDTLIASDRHAD